MTPDQIINEIFKIQNQRDPNSDPGDIDIVIQDDSALHVVSQYGRGMLGVGNSIQAALENALNNVRLDRTL